MPSFMEYFRFLLNAKRFMPPRKEIPKSATLVTIFLLGVNFLLNIIWLYYILQAVYNIATHSPENVGDYSRFKPSIYAMITWVYILLMVHFIIPSSFVLDSIIFKFKKENDNA